MIAKKMAMTIRVTSESVMLLTPAEFNDQVAAAIRLYGKGQGMSRNY
jgi:D-arabinose 5-phosphate isomerase GutQ